MLSCLILFVFGRKKRILSTSQKHEDCAIPSSFLRKLEQNLYMMPIGILDFLGQSSDSDPSSPVEFLSSRSSRKTLIYLVLTLGHMYPDYDFSSAVRAHLFFREEEWENFKQIYDTYLFEAAREWALVHGGSSLLESMTKAIDEVVKLSECEIYSYNPDFDGDPFLEKGAIWSFNFFFYNRKLKCVVSFRCCCISNQAVDGFLADEMYNDEEEDDLFIDMDM
ncbi:repressor of RNA polymerase III transcription MAF1 homolog isoform X3 [Phoenix dactylifera]|uniref:Repressor of RNA polymerase III transcription MAF1 homolog isoform X3 n=1 Tax=Phoenix dactylifera TaxID=42345 RepID=A0A8B7MTB4_PHODC|nr:repressor of RNA polymerase III transcription MAF1 homolog isoform X3 [Phoenix dactylifera]